MATEQELTDKARLDHDTLSAAYYSQSLSDREQNKADFDLQHQQIFIDLEAALIAEGYRVPPPPSIEYRLTALEEEVTKLKKDKST